MGFEVVFDNLDLLRAGFWVTLQLTLLSFAGAVAIGLVIAVMRVSPVAPLRAAGRAYVTLVRNTPLPVLAALFVFALPKVGLRNGDSFFRWAVTVLAIYHAAFVGEAVRSGFNTVARGQAEAARSLGLTFGSTLRHVVLPQALRAVVAPLGNVFVAQTKNTAVAATISVADLTQIGSRLINAESRPVQVLIGVAVGYMLITLSATALFSWLERRVAIVR